MHDHSHCDHHRPASYNAAFAIGVTLNATFVIAEFGAGFAVKSLALIADAGHNLGDVLGLLMGWTAAYLALKQPTSRHTYGYRRSTILAALTNAFLLMLVVGAVALEAIERFTAPVAVPGMAVMVVAGVGIFINGGTALMFARGRQDDLNIRGAYLHMLTDAIVAGGVVVAGFAMRLTGWGWIDSATSLCLALLIGVGSWRLLRKSIDLAMDAVPESIDPEEVRGFLLLSLPDVSDVSDLHIWAMSTTETALTAHVLTSNMWPEDELPTVIQQLRDRFSIAHSTIQLDRVPSLGCPLSV